MKCAVFLLLAFAGALAQEKGEAPQESKIHLLLKRPILGHVDELQKTARAANGGALGCGMGIYHLRVKDKTVEVRGGLDPIHVFGKEIDIEDLKAILFARADSYKNPKSPMKGDFSDLGFVTLEAVKWGMDPETFPILEKLLDDPDLTIQRFSVSALLFMEERDEKLGREIRKIRFPKKLAEIKNWRSVFGYEKPDWVLPR